MNDARRRQEMDSTGRFGVRRRATRALVAQYIHELSDRHARARPASANPTGPTTGSRGG
jgi:hypothetical protein